MKGARSSPLSCKNPRAISRARVQARRCSSCLLLASVQASREMGQKCFDRDT